MLVGQAPHVLVDARILGFTKVMRTWELAEKPAESEWCHGVDSGRGEQGDATLPT